MSSEPAPDVTLGTLWRSLTKWDKAMLLTLGVCSAAGFGLSGSLGAALRLVSYVLGLILAVRITRRTLRHLIWSLRNRLLVAYGFIAVVPVVLIVSLSAMMIYVIVGQIAVYLVTSELERRTGLLVSTVQRVADNPKGTERMSEQAYNFLTGRLPGLELLVEGQDTWRFPATATLESPPKDWGDAGGLLVKDGLLYAWAHIVRPDRSVTALLPLTSRFLASLAPNIGEVSFLRFDEDLTQPRRRLRLHRSAGAPNDADAPRNKLPEKQNSADIEVLGATALPAFLWESPGMVENELIRVRTRPITVLQTVFAAKVDVWQEVMIPVAIVISIGFLLAEVVALFIGVSITRTITSAVHGLYEGTERIREGIFSHRIQIKGNDQLASLGESFNTMTADIERLLVVAKENERLQADLEIAREVQNQLYPRVMPEMEYLRLKAMCNPARMVSGDYYDYQRLDDSRVAIAIGDVAGKGISAALLMATVQSALRTQIRHCLENSSNGESPVSTSTLVSQLNKHLYAHTTPEKYATFCFCVYDEPKSVLTYTNAGHLPPILVRRGEPQSLEVNGTVVGAFPFSRYEESHITLESGDLLLFYTDGVTEAENAYGEQYGEERLCELLRKYRERPPEEILAATVLAVRDWTGSPELQDDMTLLLACRI